MANLLQTASDWKDANNVSPPPEWNGTGYVFAAAGTLTLTATAAQGDTLTADFSGTEQNHGHQIAINVNGVDAITWSGAGSGVLSFPTSIAITLNAGDAVTIVTQNDGCGYAPDFTMTPPALPPDCDEIGRASTANVSAYDRARVHEVRLMVGEKRCLVANFNGAISAARTITSVKWRCDFGYIAQMANARIQSNNRSTAVDITANWMGDSIIRCEATLDNGEIYIQSFHVEVNGDPIFLAATSGVGPTVLTSP
jgi:hypothetical protein